MKSEREIEDRIRSLRFDVKIARRFIRKGYLNMIPEMMEKRAELQALLWVLYM